MADGTRSVPTTNFIGTDSSWEDLVTLSQVDFDYIRALVHRHSAIVLEPEKGYLAETRLLPLCSCYLAEIRTSTTPCAGTYAL